MRLLAFNNNVKRRKKEVINESVVINIVPEYYPPPRSKDWQYISEFGIKTASVWDSNTDDYTHWTGESLEYCLVPFLQSKNLTIGFNWNSFDSLVLSAYGDIQKIPSFCLMSQVANDIGTRLKLQNLGNANLIESTKVGLADFLATDPNEEEIRGYNINKITTVVKVIEKALERETLWHYQVGVEDRSPRRFYTGHWRNALNGAACPF